VQCLTGTEDVCQPPLGTDMGIVPVALNGVDSVSSNLFIAALVDHLCSLYVPNATKKDKLFQSTFFCDFIFVDTHDTLVVILMVMIIVISSTLCTL